MQQKPIVNTHPCSSRIAWATRLIMLYPAAWRERYADEMLAILEEHPPTLWTLGDLLFNLCDAHLHIDIVPTGLLTMLRRLHSSTTIIFYASLLFWLSSILIQVGLTHFFGPDINAHRPDLIGLPTYDQSMMFYSVTLYILTALTLSLGVQLLFSTGWQALKTRRIGPFLLYLFGLLSLSIAIAVGSGLGLFFVGNQPHPVQRITIVVIIFLLIVGAGIRALKVALPRTVPGTRLTHFTLQLATATSLTMLVYTISVFLMTYYEFTNTDNINVWPWVMLMGIPTIIMLFTWYLLLHGYQVRRIFKIAVQ